MIFSKKEKKKKKKKFPLLLYATAKIGEMALAYFKTFAWKKKKHAKGVIVTVQNTFMYIPLTKTPMLAFREACWFSGKKKKIL